VAELPTQFDFVHSNRRVIYEWDALNRITALAKAHGATRAAVVLDAFFAQGPLKERINQLLRDATGADAHFHAVPAHEPDTASVDACRNALVAADPDFILAVGGGSAMDTAKVARMLLSNPGPVDGIAGFGKTLAPHASLLIAAPTTAGTGSEVSESAIAGMAGSPVKLIFRSQEMTPHVALLDPALGVSAPPSVTAAAGVDAITHAVEAYVSKMASVMTDPMAESAMRLLARWLPVAYAEPTHREARGGCLIASMQAAIAFNSANLGLAHAFAAPLGAQFHVAHGVGNALALPYVMAYNAPTLGHKGETIAQIFGSANAAAAMAKARAQVGLDVSLDRYVPDDAGRDAVAASAIKSGQVRMNPRLATQDHLRLLLDAMRTPCGEDAPRLASFS
jgi:alcohol dehydrogenase